MKNYRDEGISPMKEIDGRNLCPKNLEHIEKVEKVRSIEHIKIEDKRPLLGNERIFKFRNGNGKFGIVDDNDNIIIDPIFERVLPFGDGLIKVSYKGKLGLINNDGLVSVNPIYDSLFRCAFDPNLIQVSLNNKKGIINSRGEIVVPLLFDDVLLSGKDKVIVRSQDKYGVVTFGLEEIIPCKYANIYHLKNDIFIATDAKINYIFKQTQVIGEYEYISAPCDGRIRVQKDGKYGFVDLDGRLVIRCIYDDAGDFVTGLAKAKIRNEYGFIDRSGHIIIPFIYSEAHSFNEGLAKVGKYEVWKVIKDIKYKDLKIGQFLTPDYKLEFSQDENVGYIYKFKSCYVDRYNNEYNSIVEAHLFSKYKMPFRDYMSKYLGSFKKYLLDGNCFELTDDILNRHVNAKISEWEKKREFEKTCDWLSRVNSSTKASKIKDIEDEFMHEYLVKYNAIKRAYNDKKQRLETEYCEFYAKRFKLKNIELKSYDADGEVFNVAINDLGDIKLEVPINEAQDFKSHWNDIKKDIIACYEIVDNTLFLKKITFGKYYYMMYQ